jgi:hypothetical protein
LTVHIGEKIHGFSQERLTLPACSWQCDIPKKNRGVFSGFNTRFYGVFEPANHGADFSWRVNDENLLKISEVCLVT